MTYIDQLFKIPTESFKNHLLLPDNEKILFSGRFGKGKTTFLGDYFFSDKIQEDLFTHVKHLAIHLKPVNYSISNNDDIFKLLQYDILFHLIDGLEVEFDKDEFSDSLLLHQFVSKEINPLVLFTALLSFIPKVGGELSKLVEKLKTQYDGYKKSLMSDDEKVKSFRKEVEQQIPLLEDSDISTLIENLLKTKREKESTEEKKLEIVLILDDLDRIDPHHIFRLLNVFSAHMDPWGESGNKYGFDKVVLVCDQENLAKMYSHKYGAGVDFTGYINKFYTYSVFKFRNEDNRGEYIKTIVGSIANSFQHDSPEVDDIVKRTILEPPFVSFIETLVNSNLLNLRSLLKSRGKKFNFIPKKMSLGANFTRVLSFEAKAFIQLTILNHITGDTQSLRHILNSVKSEIVIDINAPSLQTLFEQQLVLATYREHEFSKDGTNFSHRFDEIDGVKDTDLWLSYNFSENYGITQFYHLKDVKCFQQTTTSPKYKDPTFKQVIELMLSNLAILESTNSL